jgi:two-component system, response regulator RegA
MNPNPTYLLVEDDSAFRERLARALTARGGVILPAADLASARSTWQANALAGAIVDLRLPDGDGLTLVRELSAAQPGLPTVVLTGFGSIANALEAVRLGARDYLTKPADADQILLAALRGERIVRDNPKEVPAETPSLDRVEWEHIQRVLADCGGNISQTARLLGLDRRTLQRKLGKFPPQR